MVQVGWVVDAFGPQGFALQVQRLATFMLLSTGRQSTRPRFRPDPCNNALLVELRSILHIHLHSQTSKSLHPRFYLGRADHPERVK